MDGIIREIEYAIMGGEFRPKQRLVESDLMQRFSAGRGMIRDSLKILADRGLVYRNENKGAIVVELSPKQMRDLYFVRSRLEGIAAELAFDRITGKDIKQISELQQKLKKYLRVDRKLVEIHEGLHEVIFKASGNDFLSGELKRLIILTGPVRYFCYTYQDQRERSLQDHDQMIKFLKSRNKDGFVDLCRNHIIPGMEAYIRLFYPHEATDVGSNSI